MDKNRDEISAIFYDDDAQYYNENLQEGLVYGFSKGTVKEANPKYN